MSPTDNLFPVFAQNAASGAKAIERDPKILKAAREAVQDGSFEAMLRAIEASTGTIITTPTTTGSGKSTGPKR